MTTPASMSELSTTAASNNPAGSDAPSTLDDQIRALAAIVRQNVTKGADIASASAITIPASGNYFVVTGTTGITSITDTNSWYGREVVLKFSGALTITHSSSLILPGATNIITGAGDVLGFVSESSGVWRCSSINSGIKRFSKGADVASASTLTLGTDGNYFDVTGTTTITSIGTLGVGTWVKLHFDGELTLTHHATDLILPGGVNITTAAGDEIELVEYATGDWRMVGGVKADGTAWVVNSSSNLTIGAFTAWTSGAYKDITGLSGVKRLTISPKLLSTTGTSNFLIQIGDATGGLKTSGYTSGCTHDNGTRVTSTAGMIVTSTQTASESRTGTVVLTLVDESTNAWVSSGQLTGIDGIDANSGGQVTLSGPLDRFRFTTVGGTDTGDAGGFGYSVET